MIASLLILLHGCISASLGADDPATREGPVSNFHPAMATEVERSSVAIEGISSRTLAVSISPTGDFIVCGGEDGLLRTFDYHGRQCMIVSGDAVPIRTVAISPDESQIASAGAERKADPTKFTPEFLVGPGGTFIPLENTDKSSTLNAKPSADIKDELPLTRSGIESPSIRGGVINIWDAKTGKLLQTIKDSDHPIDTVAYSADGKLISTLNRKFTMAIRKAGTGQPWLTLSHNGPVHQYGEGPASVTSLSRSTLRLVSVASEANLYKASIKMWNAEGSKFRFVDPPAQSLSSWSIAMRPDGKRFITAGKNGSLYEWDFDKGSIIREFGGQPSGIPTIQYLLYNRDGSKVIAGDENGVAYLWDAISGRFIKKSGGSCRPLRAAVFLPDGLRIVSGGYHIRDPKTAPEKERGHADALVIWNLSYK